MRKTVPILCLILLWGLCLVDVPNREDLYPDMAPPLPLKSMYRMITYDSYTVTQNEFSLYYEEYDEEHCMGTVTLTDSGVMFDVDRSLLPAGHDGYKPGRNGYGSAVDRFTGYKDSLQQLTDAGYADFFVICYENGNYFMAGVKDDEIAVLPMWERMKGMEYLYSHFLEPMSIEEAEAAMERWQEYYENDTFVIMHPWLYPNMMFADAPNEVWMFSPIKNIGSQAYYGPGWEQAS